MVQSLSGFAEMCASASAADQRLPETPYRQQVETETMYNQLQPIADSGKNVGDFRHGFGSMVLYQYKLEDIGIKAAETAFRLTQPGADSVPKISYIDLTQAVFGRERDQSFIFGRKKSSVFSGK